MIANVDRTIAQLPLGTFVIKQSTNVLENAFKVRTETNPLECVPIVLLVNGPL